MDEAKLDEAKDKLEAELRRAGIYTDHMDLVPTPDGPLLLVVNATVGDIAFSDRVHDPNKHEDNSQFRGIIRDSRREEMRQMKEEAQRKAAEGGNFWDDDDDDEWDISELAPETPEEPF